MANSVDAIIIGAGPAGLAAAAALSARGLSAAILEKSDAVGAVWRRHYDRLHLHTDRGIPVCRASACHRPLAATPPVRKSSNTWKITPPSSI